MFSVEFRPEVVKFGSVSLCICYEWDQGRVSNTAASMVKLQLPKMATKIALDAIQLHGGYGYSREFAVERLMRDNKLNEIGAGTNEVMIMIIAKNMLKEMKSRMG